MEIKNESQLIESANLIESETDRVNYVLNYLLQNTHYDYAYLIAGGYMQGSISNIKTNEDDGKPILRNNLLSAGKINIEINGEEKELSDAFCQSYDIAEGKSELFDKVVALEEKNSGNKSEFLMCTYDVLLEELLKHLDNQELASQEMVRLVQQIDGQMKVGRIVGNNYISSDIKKVLLTFLVNRNKYFPPLIEDGIIKRGVCQHFADYLEELFPKIGINAVRIDGISEMGHAWIAAVVDGELKSIDLTRAIFIKDGFRGIPQEQKSSDWLLADFEDTFKMQSTRKITGIGCKKEPNENGERESFELPVAIDGTNFDKKMITDLVVEQCKKGNNKSI